MRVRLARESLLTLLILATALSGCVSKVEETGQSMLKPVQIEAPPAENPPFLSDRLVNEVCKRALEAYRGLDLRQVVKLAENDPQMASLYNTLTLTKRGFDSILSGSNSSAYLAGIYLLTAVKNAEGYLLFNQDRVTTDTLRTRALEAADQFDKEMASIIKEFQTISRASSTVESAAFLMGAEFLLSGARTVAQSCRDEASKVPRGHEYYLHQRPDTMEVTLLRLKDLAQAAKEVAQIQGTPLDSKQVLSFTHSLWACSEKIIASCSEPSQGTLNRFVYSNLVSFLSESRERSEYPYASLYFALNSAISGRLLTRLERDLGEVRLKNVQEMAPEKQKTITKELRQLALLSYNLAVTQVSRRLELARKSRRPLDLLGQAYRLLQSAESKVLSSPQETTDAWLAFLEALIISEITAASISLDQLRDSGDLVCSFERR